MVPQAYLRIKRSADRVPSPHEFRFNGAAGLPAD